MLSIYHVVNIKHNCYSAATQVSALNNFCSANVIVIKRGLQKKKKLYHSSVIWAFTIYDIGTQMKSSVQIPNWQPTSRCLFKVRLFTAYIAPVNYYLVTGSIKNRGHREEFKKYYFLSNNSIQAGLKYT